MYVNVYTFILKPVNTLNDNYDKSIFARTVIPNLLAFKVNLS